MKNKFYLVNNYLPVIVSTTVSLDFVLENLKEYYQIDIKSFSEINEKDFNYYLQKRFSRGCCDIGVCY